MKFVVIAMQIKYVSIEQFSYYLLLTTNKKNSLLLTSNLNLFQYYILNVGDQCWLRSLLHLRPCPLPNKALCMPVSTLTHSFLIATKPQLIKPTMAQHSWYVFPGGFFAERPMCALASLTSRPILCEVNNELITAYKAERESTFRGGDH